MCPVHDTKDARVGGDGGERPVAKHENVVLIHCYCVPVPDSIKPDVIQRQTQVPILFKNTESTEPDDIEFRIASKRSLVRFYFQNI